MPQKQWDRHYDYDCQREKGPSRKGFRSRRLSNSARVESDLKLPSLRNRVCYSYYSQLNCLTLSACFFDFQPSTSDVHALV